MYPDGPSLAAIAAGDAPFEDFLRSGIVLIGMYCLFL